MKRLIGDITLLNMNNWGQSKVKFLIYYAFINGR